jgi:hypothetical protein
MTTPTGGKRSELIANLARHIRHLAGHDGIQPFWAPPGTHLDVGLIGEVAVWRAANGIHPHEGRPTGAAQLLSPLALWQRDLDRRIQYSDRTFDNSVHEEELHLKPSKVCGRKIDNTRPSHPRSTEGPCRTGQACSKNRCQAGGCRRVCSSWQAPACSRQEPSQEICRIRVCGDDRALLRSTCRALRVLAVDGSHRIPKRQTHPAKTSTRVKRPLMTASSRVSW